jgi:hypothetical protein
VASAPVAAARVPDAADETFTLAQALKQALRGDSIAVPPGRYELERLGPLQLRDVTIFGSAAHWETILSRESMHALKGEDPAPFLALDAGASICLRNLTLDWAPSLDSKAERRRQRHLKAARAQPPRSEHSAQLLDFFALDCRADLRLQRVALRNFSDQARLASVQPKALLRLDQVDLTRYASAVLCKLEPADGEVAGGSLEFGRNICGERHPMVDTRKGLIEAVLAEEGGSDEPRTAEATAEPRPLTR